MTPAPHNFKSIWYFHLSHTSLLSSPVSLDPPTPPPSPKILSYYFCWKCYYRPISGDPMDRILPALLGDKNTWPGLPHHTLRWGYLSGRQKFIPGGLKGSVDQIQSMTQTKKKKEFQALNKTISFQPSLDFLFAMANSYAPLPFRCSEGEHELGLVGGDKVSCCNWSLKCIMASQSQCPLYHRLASSGWV